MVLIGQVLCPQRHCVFALASDALSAAELEATLRAGTAALLSGPGFNPWCALCGARSETWRYEVGRSRFATLAEALPALRREEQQQSKSAAELKRLGLAYDKA